MRTLVRAAHRKHLGNDPLTIPRSSMRKYQSLGKERVPTLRLVAVRAMRKCAGVVKLRARGRESEEQGAR